MTAPASVAGQSSRDRHVSRHGRRHRARRRRGARRPTRRQSRDDAEHVRPPHPGRSSLPRRGEATSSADGVGRARLRAAVRAVRVPIIGPNRGPFTANVPVFRSFGNGVVLLPIEVIIIVGVLVWLMKAALAGTLQTPRSRVLEGPLRLPVPLLPRLRHRLLARRRLQHRALGSPAVHAAGDHLFRHVHRGEASLRRFVRSCGCS